MFILTFLNLKEYKFRVRLQPIWPFHIGCIAWIKILLHKLLNEIEASLDSKELNVTESDRLV